MDRTERTPGHDAGGLALLQLAAGAAAAWLLAAGEVRLAGATVLLGAVSGAGAAALAERSGSGRAMFLTETVERLFDALVLGFVAWTFLVPDPRTGAAAIVALGTGAVTAYLRARGRGLGYRVARWPGYRVARGVVVAAGLAASVPEPALWAAVALDAGAGAARWLSVTRQGEPA